MQPLDLAQLSQWLDGFVDVKYKQHMAQVIRIPALEQPLYDSFTRFVACTAGGARLRALTNATEIEIETSQRRLRMAGTDHGAPYDLFVDGKRFLRQSAVGGAWMDDQGRLSGDETATFRARLPVGEKALEIWLPHFASVFIRRISIDDGARWQPHLDTRKRIIFHGSSITHCAEAEGPSGAWPAVAAQIANLRHLNLGWAGSCLLSGLAARIIRDQSAAAIVLKLGINVWSQGLLKERTFVDSAHSMIAIIREKHALTPIAVVSPIYSPGREDAGEGMSLQQMRAALAGVVEAHKRMGDQHIHYLSGLELFSAADAADLPDDLHPNAAGYQRMGERFVAKMLTTGKLLSL